MIEKLIKQKGKEIGFDKVTFAKADFYLEHQALEGWLAQGFHGTMEYMERGKEKRQDPKQVMPEAKSVITCALNYNTNHPYSTECKDPSRGWIARYAWGEDYHTTMTKMLETLREQVLHQVPGTLCKSYVDTGPVMERVFAKNSGTGWIGKNTCIIDPKLGSWLLLGVILTDLELTSDAPMMDHCGKCTACIDACPTQAIIPPPVRSQNDCFAVSTGGGITQPYKIDARKCISYLTIEHRGEIDSELKSKMGKNIFGCDICQDVCPWNKKAPATTLPAFQPREGFFNPNLDSFEKMVTEEYPQRFKNSPLKRGKQAGLLRNIAIAKEN